MLYQQIKKKMNNREARKQIAENTLQILEQGYFETPEGSKIEISTVQQNAEDNTIVYRPEVTDELLQNTAFPTQEKPTEISVTGQTTLDAVRSLIREGYEDVLCLNFASARNAGGGFLGGSQAQEESIARSTGLYNCQQRANEYYEVNRKVKSCIYTDYMIYSPAVPIIKDEEGRNHNELMTCGVITAPAVNAGIVKQREPKKLEAIEEVMRRRIKKVLAIALEHNHETIVLGAWGCGVFQNDPKDIAQYFKEIIEGEYKDKFRKIVFAIYARNERFITPFLEAFNK